MQFRYSILLATSDSKRRKLWRHAFESRGMNVFCCRNGKQIIETLGTKSDPAAIVFESPMEDGSNLVFLSDLIGTPSRRPVTVVSFRDCVGHQFAQAISLGMDLPLFSEQLPSHELVSATLHLIEHKNRVTDDDEQWSLDITSWALMPPSSVQCVPLTYKEREFLLKLANQPGEPVAKEDFVALFDTTPELFDPRRLEIMVRRLKTKVRHKTDRELPLHTAYGVGYALGVPMLIVNNGGCDHSV